MALSGSSGPCLALIADRTLYGSVDGACPRPFVLFCCYLALIFLQGLRVKVSDTVEEGEWEPPTNMIALPLIFDAKPTQKHSVLKHRSLCSPTNARAVFSQFDLDFHSAGVIHACPISV